ncbi:MAG: flavodoxin-dependent (E)-4-hydroxy-3-methylbut-2-enyl-diphosphate synthase [Peptococcaceae bacterium]|nr:flavodoxin-dependent (E)-4-hydroxy-3-methylbut-2-enyl-diphosphate synthase [Peptococcaceae bacterium]
MRRKTISFKIRDVGMGADYPVTVQSMTNTDSHDVEATLAQVLALADAGAALVRIAVPDQAAVAPVAEVAKQSPVPIVADIHFDHRLALAALDAGVDAVRINPGNIGGLERLGEVVEAAKRHDAAIRIGVNSGSVEKEFLEKYGHPCVEALVESLEKYVSYCESLDFHKLVLSVKSSDVAMMIRVNEVVAEKFPYPLHLGVTEAGTVRSGTIKSSIGIGSLLAHGIGDTIRVSLTGDPLNELPVAFGILKSLHLVDSGVDIVSCPTCGRTQIDLATLAEAVEALCQTIDVPLKIAVMGCVVNGPGEAREADLGIAGGRGVGIIFHKGEIVRRCKEEDLLDAFKEELAKLLAE